MKTRVQTGAEGRVRANVRVGVRARGRVRSRVRAAPHTLCRSSSTALFFICVPSLYDFLIAMKSS